MRHLVKEAGAARSYFIDSAATSREELGNPIYPPAKRALAAHGIPSGDHTARQMTRADYDGFDLLIGMDHRNLANMRRIAGSDPESKICLLLAYAGRPEDEVADPWYTGDFEATFRDVRAGCLGLLAALGTDLSACIPCAGSSNAIQSRKDLQHDEETTVHPLRKARKAAKTRRGRKAAHRLDAPSGDAARREQKALQQKEIPVPL